MCDKAVDTYQFVFGSVSDRYKTQESCNKVVSEELCMLKSCHNKYKVRKCVIKLSILIY